MGKQCLIFQGLWKACEFHTCTSVLPIPCESYCIFCSMTLYAFCTFMNSLINIRYIFNGWINFELIFVVFLRILCQSQKWKRNLCVFMNIERNLVWTLKQFGFMTHLTWWLWLASFLPCVTLYSFVRRQGSLDNLSVILLSFWNLITY